VGHWTEKSQLIHYLLGEEGDSYLDQMQQLSNNRALYSFLQVDSFVVRNYPPPSIDFTIHNSVYF